MKRKVGLWIDHKEAFLVFVGDDREQSARLESGIEKHVRFSGGNRPVQGQAEDQRDSQYTAHLNRYYDEVIAHVRDAESILLFGPGEAKRELESRLVSKGLGAHIVAVETVDKMTVPQIAAKVREHFGT